MPDIAKTYTVFLDCAKPERATLGAHQRVIALQNLRIEVGFCSLMFPS